MSVELNDEPIDALEKINKHTHEDIGNPIPTGGIADKAVTAEKLADEAVTGEKIKSGEITSKHLKDKSISVDKIADDIAFGGGTYTLKNYIGDGLHIKPAGDLKMKVTAGRCNIDEYQMSLLSDKEVDVKPNTGGLIYLEKTENYEPVVKIREYELPQPNEYTLVRYTFNGKREDMYIEDSSGNGNDMLISGKVTTVDGICGNNALEYDGSTGYSTSIYEVNPDSSNQKHVDIVFSTKNPKTQQYIAGHTDTTSATWYFRLGVVNQKLEIYYNNSSYYPDNVIIERDKKYYIAIRHNGSYSEIYLNGQVIHRIPINLTVRSFTLKVGCNCSGGYFGNCRFYYLEILKYARLPEEISEIANKMGFTNTYTTQKLNYPTMQNDWSYREWKVNQMGEIPDTGTKENPVSLFPEYVADTTKTNDGSMWVTTSPFGNSVHFNASQGLWTKEAISVPKLSGCTVIMLFTADAASPGRVCGIRTAGSTAGNYDVFGIYDSGNVFGYYNGTWYTVNRNMNYRGPVNFLAYRFKDGYLRWSCNDWKEIDYSVVTNVDSNYLFALAHLCTDANMFKGEIHYVAIIDKELSDIELKQVYESIYSQDPIKKDIRSIISSDAMPIGSYVADSKGIIEYSEDYSYGRREKAVGGNRVHWTGWIYVTLAQNIWIDNPFGTTNIKCTVYGNTEPVDNNILQDGQVYSDGTYGTFIPYIRHDKICIAVGDKVSTWARLRGVGAGFINVRIEVLDD